ncbi:hypothetical protein PUNSTDRAFT_44643 [Punctularia strigosozonata HHB-11173 SS5]|uniref:uncharacterized protein n=1 Tax=Punctularia strigosozonata (strain HHB-11173) TaxID=741275 RepID=UPI0004417BF5|nr:uncharacterized protein PUNSTDRAFT_44643 [Punctularia strigosozonata HHB-11173 SS5]EIN09248.1 hypothetical protein PUNSTDRAFT_44643 [Punctularia strigosozonata HHB-11173 SS5]
MASSNACHQRVDTGFTMASQSIQRANRIAVIGAEKCPAYLFEHQSMYRSVHILGIEETDCIEKARFTSLLARLFFVNRQRCLQLGTHRQVSPFGILSSLCRYEKDSHQPRSTPAKSAPSCGVLTPPSSLTSPIRPVSPSTFVRQG